MESCSRIKDRNGRLAQGEDEVRKMWKENFEDLYNIDTQEEIASSRIERSQVRMRSQEKG